MKKIVLKRCVKDNMAYNDFVYGEVGTVVEAKDWVENQSCGNGLHGWTDGAELYSDKDLQGNFVVLEVETDDGFVNLGDKVKFRKGIIIYNSPDASGAHKIMKETYPNMLLHYSTNKQGNYSANRQGSYSTNKQGDYSTNIQDDSSTNNQGDYSANRQDSYSTNKQGSHSTNKQGYYSANKQGDYSANKQGDYSTNRQGSYSTNTVFGTDNISKIFSNLHCTVMYNDNEMKVFQGGVDYFQGETIVIHNMKIIKRYNHTGENITKLEDHEVFVFGSNLNGNHAGGAAKQALEFGAVDSDGHGLNGQSYAFPTLDKDMQRFSTEQLSEFVNEFYRVVNQNTTKIFLLTKVGCGIAGYDEEFMRMLFKDSPANVVKPEGW